MPGCPPGTISRPRLSHFTVVEHGPTTAGVLASSFGSAAPRAPSRCRQTADKPKGPASYFPSIEKKYGRPIEEWKQIVRDDPSTKHSELVTMLKDEHGMGHGHATAVVADTLREDS